MILPGCILDDQQAPLGGFKSSGIGREIWQVRDRGVSRTEGDPRVIAFPASERSNEETNS